MLAALLVLAAPVAASAHHEGVVVGPLGDDDRGVRGRVVGAASMTTWAAIVAKHLGPGDHPSGTSQDVHGSKGGEGSAHARARGVVFTGSPPRYSGFSAAP